MASDRGGSIGPKAEPGRRYDAALHLLDRQILDPDGRLVAKLDDLELTQRQDGRLVVTAMLTGPGALGPRLGGRLGAWTVAIWRRLRADVEPEPGRITIADLVDLDSAVHVSARLGDLRVNGFETWVDDHVVSRLPGATDEPD
jgi:hypothetical protein